MSTYDGHVSQYLLRPPRSCDQVMGTSRLEMTPTMSTLSTAEQNRSKGRRKTGPFSVMRYAVLRVVPLVHRRAPRCFA